VPRKLFARMGRRQSEDLPPVNGSPNCASARQSGLPLARPLPRETLRPQPGPSPLMIRALH
jgi:hypothetical protein